MSWFYLQKFYFKNRIFRIILIFNMAKNTKCLEIETKKSLKFRFILNIWIEKLFWYLRLLHIIIVFFTKPLFFDFICNSFISNIGYLELFSSLMHMKVAKNTKYLEIEIKKLLKFRFILNIWIEEPFWYLWLLRIIIVFSTKLLFLNFICNSFISNIGYLELFLSLMCMKLTKNANSLIVQ